MTELRVWTLVSVVEVSGIKRVRTSERVVDLRFLSFSGSQAFSLFIAVHKASLIKIVVITILDALVAIDKVSEFIDVSSIVLLVTVNELIHFLVRVV